MKRERELLSELLELVQKRSFIVDSLEEERVRYLLVFLFISCWILFGHCFEPVRWFFKRDCKCRRHQIISGQMQWGDFLNYCLGFWWYSLDNFVSFMPLSNWKNCSSFCKPLQLFTPLVRLFWSFKHHLLGFQMKHKTSFRSMHFSHLWNKWFCFQGCTLILECKQRILESLWWSIFIHHCTNFSFPTRRVKNWCSAN